MVYAAQPTAFMRAAADAGAGDYIVSQRATAQRYPNLAMLTGAALDLVTGARPASAATMQGPGGGAPSSVSHPTLSRLATGRMIRPTELGYRTDRGLCTTAVLETLNANGFPNKITTGNDPGNNPRSLASQLIRQHGWQPLPGLGREQIIQSPAGTFSANVIPEAEYLGAVRSGRIPSGALVFSTIHGGWQGTSPGSKGYDVAIARNGGQNLWNGYLSNTDVYQGAAKWRMVLIPRGSAINGSPLARN
jgi:hypothetical protein